MMPKMWKKLQPFIENKLQLSPILEADDAQVLFLRLKMLMCLTQSYGEIINIICHIFIIQRME